MKIKTTKQEGCTQLL